MIAQVIDINMLQDEALGHWLASSQGHQAVLTDFAMVETWSCSDDDNTLRSFEILRRFPHQVLKMHTCNKLREMEESRRMRDLIDWDATEDLRLFLQADWEKHRDQLLTAIHGNRDIAREKVAEVHRDAAANKATIETIGPIIRPFITNRDADGMPVFSNSGIEQIRLLALRLAESLHQQGVEMGIRRPTRDIRSTFELRYAAVAMSHMAIRLGMGTFTDLSDKKARNDVIDCNHIACSTYFHGFQTKDQMAQRIHRFATDAVIG